MKRLLVFLLLVVMYSHAQGPPHQARTLSGVNAQTGTSYTFVGQDSTYLVTFSNVNPTVATLPPGTTNGFGAGNEFSIQNIGPGDVTITCSGCLIYINSSAGASSILLQGGQGVDLYGSGLNYSGELGSGGGGGSTLAGSQFSVPYYSAPGTNNILSAGQAFDNQTDPFRSPNGFDVGSTGGYDYQVANDTVTGTANLLLACNNGAQKAITCPAATSTTNHSIGFVAKNGGTSGNAVLCNLGWCSAILDNQSTAGDHAIASPSVSGELTDVGVGCVGGQENYLVFSPNTGPGSASLIRMLNANDPCGGGGTGFVNPMTTLGDYIVGSTAGAAVRLAGPVTPNSVPQTICSTPAGGLATIQSWCLPGIAINAQTGTTYTVAATDRVRMVTFSNGSPIAVTLPQAGTTGFGSNFVFEACNIGAGTATITPTTSTISYTTGTGYTGGAASLALTTGKCAKITSDNTNYYATSNTGTGSGSGTVTSVGLTVNSTSPSGIFTVTGSPVTTSGSLNLNLAGTSGGIPYFSSTTGLSSSALLTAHGVVIGGGAATSPGSTSAGAADTIFMGNDSGTGSDPAFKAGPSGGTNGCAGTTDTPTYNTTTHAWGCHQIAAGTGTVTSVGLSGTANQITVTGATPITSSGSWTLSLPSNLILPNGTTATTQAAGDSSSQVATNAFVATAIQGVNPAVAVQAATTVAGDTSAFTYSNGVAGIGATLTGPTNNTAVTIDGYTFTALGQRLLVKNDTQSPSGAFNGVYYVTTLQTIGIKPILTRALDYDMPSDINNTGAIPVINGTVNGTTQWVLTSQVTTVGTDPLTYVKFSSNPSTIVTSAASLTDHAIVLGSGGGQGIKAGTLGTTTTVLHGNASGDPTYGAVVGADMTNATVTATQLAAQYSKGSCTEVWGGSGTANAMASGDDAIVNNSCYNDSGVTRTITAVKCRSDNAANTTVLTPTFGSAGTGTAILTGTVTCGNSYAYSATGTLTNTAWTTGTGIDPGMSTVGNATSVALIVEYTY